MIEARLQRGEPLPGFGHKLYPMGDPRAAALLRRLPGDALTSALVATGDRITGQAPNVDFAPVALSRALGLPRGSALVIFAVARTAGWIAHALEQHAEGKLTRPRAQYIGVRPG